MYLQRLALPQEHFEIQGYDMFSGDTATEGWMQRICQEGTTSMRSLAGSGMHVAGASLMFILACTEFRDV